jgi:hypothetical protein
MEIAFDMDVVITTSITYSKFVIRDIKIQFGEPARIDVMLIQKIPVSTPLYDTIFIPVDIYTNWKYDENTIIDFVKNYIQEMYHDWNQNS